MTADQPTIIGELVVVALKARDLPNIEVVGKQDPFCVFRLGETAKRTKTDYRGGQQPLWDDQVNLPVPEKKTKMYVQVFDEDSKREDLICEGEVDLSQVLREGEQDSWFPLKYRGKDSGKIYLELTFYSARQPPKRQPTRLYNKARPQHLYQRAQQMQQQSPYPNHGMVPPMPQQSSSTPVTAAGKPSAGPPIYRPPPPPGAYQQEHIVKQHMPPPPYPPRMTPSVSTGTAMSHHGYPPQQQQQHYRPPGGRPASFGAAPMGFHIPQQQPPSTPAMPGFSFPEPQAMPAGGFTPHPNQNGQPFAAHQAPYPPPTATAGYPPTGGYPPPQQGYPPF
ncbi:c2 domain containing protein [Lichtheimia corymbifera JMRC:FSU:9682]|uniref:C2 domain containing protein n=1 Tax=Lichtheimia corymbifera JMRC:FSU:9682 TaxID=1263082 RepID=A0A068S538_9FUNG|nr:c2 domain containing protein [Lichtheimia corymbifera JMRC:FSU:9682]